MNHRLSATLVPATRAIKEQPKYFRVSMDVAECIDDYALIEDQEMPVVRHGDYASGWIAEDWPVCGYHLLYSPTQSELNE